MKKAIEITNSTTVGELADKLMVPVTTLITELFKNGVMVTVNERIDPETAEIIIGELDLSEDFEVKKIEQQSGIAERKKVEQSDKAVDRPPIVAVMGHVDHGKTSLLDAIRQADVAKGEAGGITQHISAYQIEHSGRKVTFLDTPGHEAFAALREHGAHLTDVVVIVVAADDGVKPQTEEAIRFAKKAGSKIIVAINKIDKPGADANRVMQQLSELELMPEDWGGETIMVPVSAKENKGIDKLLEMVFLVADVEELKADVDVPAQGLVIEAHMEQGRGAIASVLVEMGVLRQGQFVVAGTTFGKVKNLETTLGEKLEEAIPSTPAQISGLKELPGFGDVFYAVDTEKEAKEKSAKAKDNAKKDSRLGVDSSRDLMRMMNRSKKVTELPVIIKADVKGSLTTVIDSLKTLENDEVSVKFVNSGVGGINDSDLHQAKTSGAIIYGFNVEIPTNIKGHSVRDSVSVKQYKVIYELIDDVKAELSELLQDEIVETETGRLVVRGVFNTTKNEIICGGEVTKGKIVMPSLAKLYKDKEVVAEVELTGLKKGPAEVKQVNEGEMCGVQLKTPKKLLVEEGDKIEFFTRESISKKL
ncbi:MAG: translation initiation factor IF-2 [bacterium]|nr:translation initiation factor IF-2 [bacterium]